MLRSNADPEPNHIDRVRPGPPNKALKPTPLLVSDLLVSGLMNVVGEPRPERDPRAPIEASLMPRRKHVHFGRGY